MVFSASHAPAHPERQARELGRPSRRGPLDRPERRVPSPLYHRLGVLVIGLESLLIDRLLSLFIFASNFRS
jgi:hypothetical protein